MKFALFTLSMFATIFGSTVAFAGQHEINGFRYQSCDSRSCVEVTSERAWISQVDFGFSAEGSARVREINLDGTVVRDAKGTEASLIPNLGLLTLETMTGETVVFELKEEEGK